MRRPTVQIEKNGKKREIVIYSREEIQAQRDLNASLQLIFEDHTHDAVCSYRSGRSTIQVVQGVSQVIGQYRYALKLDIRDYFPSISRRMLAQRLNEIFHSKTKGAIMDYVCAAKRGIAQGSPLSPALSNIYLYEFDVYMSGLHDVFYLRYCDDILVLTNLNPALVLRAAEEELAKHALRLKREKTQVVETGTGFDYLGFHINTSGYWITPKKVTEILDRINQAKSRRQRRGIINGWWAYCKSSDYLPTTFNSVLLLTRSGRIGDAYRMVGEMTTRKGSAHPPQMKTRHARHVARPRLDSSLRRLVRTAGLIAGVSIWAMANVCKLASWGA